MNALAWMEENAAKLRQAASGERILFWPLGIGIVVGLAAHVGGYTLQSSLPAGLPGLLGDLLHALGWSLWTGVVVVVFVQVIPEVKRRQIRQALDAYEAVRREKASSGKTRRSPSGGTWSRCRLSPMKSPTAIT